MVKLVQAVGQWVEKERFWDRETEVAELTRLLDEGANILITAPRRIGKTSLIREIGNRVKDRYICLQLDLQKSHSPADVIAELSAATRPHRGLWNKTKVVFKNIGTGFENIDSLNPNDLVIKFRDGLLTAWQDKANLLIEAMAGGDKPTVIFMDEFPLVINRLLKGPEYHITPERLKEADAFLSWVRWVTIQYPQKIRLVIAGSIGLEPVLQQARLSHTINTFAPFQLEPWDKETASGCLHALAENYAVDFQAGAIEKMLELLGCYIPHHVQMFFQYIMWDCRKRPGCRCTVEDAERIYKSDMLSVRGHAELSTYEERLKMVLDGDMLDLTLALLTEAAVSRKLTTQTALILCRDFNLEGKRPEEALIEIFHILEHDGYLARKKDVYVFISNLVRDWFKARFGSMYTPVSKRGAKP